MREGPGSALGRGSDAVGLLLLGNELSDFCLAVRKLLFERRRLSSAVCIFHYEQTPLECREVGRERENVYYNSHQ